MYRTGDRARFLADGNIEYLGRLDQQVKIRGVRIELGEVEAVLRSHDGVREAVAIVRAARGETQLVAYVVPQHATAPNAAQLRSYLRTRLPEVMVPAFIVSIDTIPLSPNGKLDRRALPDPLDVPTAAPAEAGALSAIERTVAEAWTTVLGGKQFGRDDNFFDVGGHSLSAMRVHAVLQPIFGPAVSLRILFEHPTVSALARHLAGTGPADGASAAGSPAAITRVARQPNMPVSAAQHRFWLLHQLDNGGATYNIVRVMRLRGALDAGAFEPAWRDLIERHEALRTSFALMAGEPVQNVHPPADFTVALTDVSSLAASERLAAARNVAVDESFVPFDLARAPLVRARLVRMAEDDHLVVVSLHHIIADGRSVEVLFEELAAAYDARRKGGPAALPAIAVQYADYAAFEQNWLATPDIDTKIKWWKTQLAGAPPLLPLPADRPRPRVQSFDGEIEVFVIGPELTARLRKVAADHGASLFMTVLTGFAALLARYSGQSDLCIASPIENRGVRETERLIGAFLNTIILRVNCGGDPAFETLLNRVRGTALDAYDRHDAPFQRVVDALQPDRRIAASPLAQVSISWLGGQGGFLTLPGLGAEPIAFDYNRVKLDLELEVHETASELHVAWAYSTALFTRASMQWMIADFLRLLESATTAPATPLSRLDVRPDTDRGSLLQVRPSLATEHAALDGPPVAARNDLERDIEEVWSSILGVSDISVNADLFSIGGHSLMAIRIAAQLAGRFDIDLRPSAVFNAPTIALLAETVAALQAARLEAILGEVESLSEDEAKANLTT